MDSGRPFRRYVDPRANPRQRTNSPSCSSLSRRSRPQSAFNGGRERSKPRETRDTHPALGPPLAGSGALCPCPHTSRETDIEGACVCSGKHLFNPTSKVQVKRAHQAETRTVEMKRPSLQELGFLRASAPPRELLFSVLRASRARAAEPGAESACPFKGKKTQIFEGGIRSPLTARDQTAEPGPKSSRYSSTSRFKLGGWGKPRATARAPSTATGQLSTMA